MIEVLVTILVVSFGLLGLAALIANSMKANQSATTRTQAGWLAYEMIDRMRANRVTANVTTSPYILDSCSPAPTGSTPAANDLLAWCSAIGSLPSGNGNIAYTSATGVFTITVTWDDASRQANQIDNSGRVVLETRL